MNQSTEIDDITPTKRVLIKRRQLERQIAHLEAINSVLRDELPSKNDQISRLEERITNMSIEQRSQEQRIAELEAINAALRAELPSKNKRIAMLERRISNMSVDLASSRAREDETSLMLRRSSQGSAMSEGDGNVLPTAAELIDESMKSASSPAQTSSSSSSYRQFHRSFSLPIPSWVPNSSSTQDDINDSTRSHRLTGVSSIIGNMMKLDRSESSKDLRVDFPAGGRESYRLRMSDLTADLTADYSAEEKTCEQEKDHQKQELGGDGGQKKPPSTPPRRRRPNRSLSIGPLVGSNNSRLISSTVIFPTEDDDDSLGFK